MRSDSCWACDPCFEQAPELTIAVLRKRILMKLRVFILGGGLPQTLFKSNGGEEGIARGAKRDLGAMSRLLWAGDGGKRRRRCIIQPRVGGLAPTLGTGQTQVPTPTGLHPPARHHRLQPRWGWGVFMGAIPRVARGEQPWAE